MEQNITEQGFVLENISQVQDPRILATSYMMYKMGDALNQFYVPALVPIGVLGNVLSFLVMIQPQNRHMSFSLYICALAIVDTVALLNAIPSYLDLVHQVDMPPNRSGYCTILIFTVHFSFLCSCYLLIAMTFERFYSIIRPHKAASFNTVKRAKSIIVCVFIFACCYSIPFLFITGNFGRSCVPNRFATDNILGELYSWLTQTVILIFPFISLLTMNSVIIHTLRKRSKIQLLGSAGQAESEAKALKLKRSEKQVITTLLLITFSFLIFNVPGRVLVFFLDFYSGDTPYYYAGLHLFYQIGVVTYYTNHGINFFLYVISGHKFRTDLKNLFFLKTRTENDNVASNVTSTVAMSSSN